MNQSINESFNKGNISTKHKNLNNSSYMIKNDTTLITNEFSRQSVFDRLYQNSRKKKVIKNCINDSMRK